MKLTLNKALLGAFILIAVVLILTLKIGGASPDLVKNPEHDGYCKIVYGEDFKYSPTNNYCFGKSEKVYFTEEEFRSVCPIHKFLEWGFYSDCFKHSESI